jgi:hypothetical protein
MGNAVSPRLSATNLFIASARTTMALSHCLHCAHALLDLQQHGLLGLGPGSLLRPERLQLAPCFLKLVPLLCNCANQPLPGIVVSRHKPGTIPCIASCKDASSASSALTLALCSLAEASGWFSTSNTPVPMDSRQRRAPALRRVAWPCCCSCWTAPCGPASNHQGNRKVRDLIPPAIFGRVASRYSCCTRHSRVIFCSPT